MGKVVKNLGLYLVLVLAVVSMVNTYLTPEEVQKQYDEISYSQFLKELDAGTIRILQIRNNTTPGESTSAVIQGELANEQRFLTYGLDVSGIADSKRHHGNNRSSSAHCLVDEFADLAVPDIAFNRRVGLFYEQRSARRLKQNDVVYTQQGKVIFGQQT